MLGAKGVIIIPKRVCTFAPWFVPCVSVDTGFNSNQEKSCIYYPPLLPIRPAQPWLASVPVLKIVIFVVPTVARPGPKSAFVLGSTKFDQPTMRDRPRAQSVFGSLYSHSVFQRKYLPWSVFQRIIFQIDPYGISRFIIVGNFVGIFRNGYYYLSCIASITVTMNMSALMRCGGTLGGGCGSGALRGGGK